MSRVAWKSGTAFRFDVYVFDNTDAAKTGLVDGDFTKQLAKDGAHSAVTVTVTEVSAANQPGRYTVTFTPNATGYWSCRVAHSTHAPRGFQEDLQVYADDPHDTADVATGILDRTDGVETSWTLRKALRVLLAFAAGKTSGQKTAPVFRDIGDTKARITATVDSSGNRTAVTADGT